MSDAPASPKKKAPAKTKAKTASTHPPVSTMVIAAIKNLKDRKGSSLPAIKKYINANYKCDAAKLAPFIRRFLKKAVEEKKLVQTKGTGASGSFKLPAKEKEEKPKKAKKPAKAKKPKAEKKPRAKKATPKKAAKPKKPKATKAKKAKPAAKKAKAPAKRKSPAKKTAAKKTKKAAKK